MRRNSSWLLVALVIVAVLALALWVGPQMMRAPKRALPAGWQIIRPPHEVSALAIQGNVIWAGGKDGVVGVDRFTGRIVAELACDGQLVYTRALLVDRNGILWIGHQDGLTRYDGSACVTYTEKDGLPDSQVNALLETHNGEIWVGTSRGAAYHDVAGWHVLTVADGLADDMVNVMLEDSEGGMWFGSYTAPRGGLSYLKYGQWQIFSTSNGLPHNGINALLEDQSGHIWAGTGMLDRGGAAVFVYGESGLVLEDVLASSDGLAGNNVRSIYQDRDGVFWFGSEYDGIARLDTGSWQVLTVEDGLSDPEVKCIVQDEDGNLWLGTMDGITRISAQALDAL